MLDGTREQKKDKTHVFSVLIIIISNYGYRGVFSHACESFHVASLELIEGAPGCSGYVCHKDAIEIYFTDAFLKRRAGSRAEEMKTRPHYVRGQGAQELASDLCLSGGQTA